jgi:hypothetical protein
MARSYFSSAVDAPQHAVADLAECGDEREEWGLRSRGCL